MKQSRMGSMWISLLSVGALVGLVACTPEASAPGEADAQDAVEASEAALDAEADGPRGERRHGMKHGGQPGKGPLALFRHALGELELDEAQKKIIDAELAALESERPDMKPAFAKHQAALAAAVRTGSVDRDKLAAELGDGQHAEMRTRMNAALSKLHATLRPEQRKALSDAVLAKMDDHAERKADRGDDQRGGKRLGKGPGRMGGRGPMAEHGPMGRGPMDHLIGELELSDEQRTKIEAGFEALREAKGEPGERFEEHHAAMRKAAEAFASDRFDPSAFGPPGGEMRGPGAMMIDALGVIVPALDEAQREALAKRIEAGPPEHGKRGKMGPRRGPAAAGDTSL